MKSTKIMSIDPTFVNPHAVNFARLPRVDDRILLDLLALRRAELAPIPRLHLAGIPPLTDLEAERRRRGAS
jgi:hypothetical protein